jgi:arylsulfatase A-like enzyme
MDRRTFLKKVGATGGALATAGLLGNQSKAQGGPPPNILFIIVDELRYWRVFPKGINDVGEFLREFMPNTYQLLWVPGVKFAGHYTAGTACTPARGTLVTGLYTQQNWLLATIQDSPTTTVSEQPVLNRAYPTYGKLLQQAGYQTPYIGKWHLSIPHRDPMNEALTAYGFEGMTEPDPVGNNLEGTIGNLAEQSGFISDSQIASQAVGFINPHDKEFFPAGTEFQTFTNLFSSPSYNPDNLAQYINWTNPEGGPTYDYNSDPLKSPPSLDYPAVPPNWESAAQLAKNKPSQQTQARLFQQLVWGGVSDDPSATDFSIVEYPTNPKYPPLKQPLGVPEAPFSYWQRALDSYTQVMTIVDQNIGLVLDALPSQVAKNTVVVFTSDHGDYASAHGFVSGKVGSCYEEVYNVPLIVVDPTGRFTGDIPVLRTGLSSSVDILPLLVSLGHNGSQSWMAGDLAAIYGKRLNLLPMLQSASAPGRPYVVFADDDPGAQLYNFNTSPAHIIGLRTPVAKLGVYADWVPGTTRISPSNLELEYYDYTTPGGLLETDNRKDDPAAIPLLVALLTDVLPNELQAPLPAGFVPAQTTAKTEYLGYVDLLNAITTLEDTVAILPTVVGDV